MLPDIHRATQKFYIFLIVYLTGCTPENGHFVAIATGRAHYKAENFTLAMAGVLSWMIQKMFI